MTSGRRLVTALRTPDDFVAAAAFIRRIEAQARVGVPVDVDAEVDTFVADLEKRRRDSAQRVAALAGPAKSAHRSVRRHMREDADVRLFIGVGDTPAGLQRLAVERHGATLTDDEAGERVRCDGIRAYYRLRREYDPDAPSTFLDDQVWGLELREIQRAIEQYLAVRGHEWGARAGLARRAGVSDNYIGRIRAPDAQSMNLAAADRIRTALRDLGYSC
jgi:hypothetical protein